MEDKVLSVKNYLRRQVEKQGKELQHLKEIYTEEDYKESVLVAFTDGLLTAYKCALATVEIKLGGK